MNGKKITAFQLFSLIVLFELGSAIVVGLGMDAKQDAWIAVLLGMAAGVGIFAVYCYLHSIYPFQPITSYLPRVLGRWVGYPIAAVYICYFTYIAARILRDVGDLIVTTQFNETPLFAINGLLMLVVAYGLALGLGVLGRSGEIFFLICAAFILFLVVSIFLTPRMLHPEHLLPMLENGGKPVLKTAFPLTATFPFGETIAFAAILPWLQSRETAWRTGAAAIVMSGLLLAGIRAVDIAVLGAQYAAGSQFPFLETTRHINIGEFVQRLDALVLSLLVIGGFFKIAVFTFAAVDGIRRLPILKKVPSWLSVVSLSATVYFASLYMARNIVEHLETGLKTVPMTMHVPLQYGVPLLLAAIVLVRRIAGPNGAAAPGSNEKRSFP